LFAQTWAQPRPHAGVLHYKGNVNATAYISEEEIANG
jgi:hypothetical protein